VTGVQTCALPISVHLQACLEAFFASGAACAVSVTEAEHHPLKFLVADGGHVRAVDPVAFEQPRQRLPLALRPTGAIYVMARRLFAAEMRFLVPPALGFPMSQEESIDIDSPLDLLLAEQVLSRRLHPCPS
jgi:N-acylneuraminate cytidylyltransferase